MALTEQTVLDKIELIIANGVIQVRNANIIKRDDVEISRSLDRYVLSPGDDVSGQPKIIQGIATLFWTPEVIQTYQSIVAKSG